MNGATLTIAIVLQTAAMAVCMSIAWMAWRRTGNAGWIDTSWTFAVGLVAAVAALWPLGANEWPQRQWLVAALVAGWALRLGTHIARRTFLAADDPRYAALVREWGVNAPRRMFAFVQIQAIAAIPLLATIFVAAHTPGGALGVSDWLGAALLVIAIVGEAVADAQLRKFTTDPRNKNLVCDRGLWSWSRHPNYFFQWLGWLAYPIISLVSIAIYPWALITLSGAACMYWLLVRVSGIPPLESHMARSRGAAFRDYQSRTNAFFPWPPHAPASRPKSE